MTGRTVIKFNVTAILITLLSICASAQTFTTLANFNGSNGEYPYAPLTQGVDGNLYGTTYAGGISNSLCRYAGTCGTLFKLSHGGLLTTVYDFCSQTNCADGYAPYAGLTVSSNGNLYGSARQGGQDSGGNIFKLSPNGSLTAIHQFCSANGCPDGSGPDLPLVNSALGYFFGTTLSGGTEYSGTVFRMTVGGNITTIWSFDPEEGSYPTAFLQGFDGSLYGATSQGGFGYGCQHIDCGGVLFHLTQNGEYTLVHSFCYDNCTDGQGPTSLIQGVDGSFYGTAFAGGVRGEYGDGTVFRMERNYNFTVLYNFCSLSNCADGSAPQTLIQGSDGNFYGTTNGGGDINCNPTGFSAGCGTVFKLTSDGVLTVLHSFEATDGLYPYGLVQRTDGKFYGVTENGGSSSACYLGCGTVYRLDMGLTPFVRFVVASGRIGQAARILGQGFTGTTDVSLNGTRMSFTVVSDTLLRAIVPSGATTGYVTVSIPSGTLKSNVPFQVIP